MPRRAVCLLTALVLPQGEAASAHAILSAQDAGNIQQQKRQTVLGHKHFLRPRSKSAESPIDVAHKLHKPVNVTDVALDSRADPSTACS